MKCIRTPVHTTHQILENQNNNHCIETLLQNLSSTSSGPVEDTSRWIQSINVDRLEELLKKNTHKIDFMDKGGMTLLHRSILANRLEIVRLLIDLGANVTLANRDGWSPLHLAAHAGNSDIITYLLQTRN